MSSWLDMFRDTITCPSCKGHFTTLLANYRVQFPNMLANRHEFIMFTFRAHNAVNKRLNKPVFSSVESSLSTLKHMVATRSARDYRTAYLAHITRHWKIFQDISGIVALKKLQEMRRIELEYISPRDLNFAITVREDVVVLPQSVMERDTEAPQQRPIFLGNAKSSAGFRITAGGLRLRR